MHEKKLTIQWSRKGINNEEHTAPADGFFGFLDRLRAKPVHVRERLAWISTIALSLLIGSVWWNSWNAQSSFAEENIAAVASPWSMVRETFAGAKDAAIGVYDDTVGDLDTLGTDLTPEQSALLDELGGTRSPEPTAEQNSFVNE